MRRLQVFLFSAVLCHLAVLSTSAKVYSDIVTGGGGGVFSQHIGNRISSCKGQKGVKTNQQLVEAGIEKFRRGESGLGGILYCREAFPIVKKYALDPDPKLREVIAYYLRLYYSPEALQLLIQQIEKYPSDRSAFPYAYAADHPCYFFRKVKTRSLTQAIAARIKDRGGYENGSEIRVLGCLSPKDPEARKFLEEMRQPSFPNSLIESDRKDQLNLVTYALAEAGVKEAESKVLADIENATVVGNGPFQSVLEKTKGFTNCRILQALARLILDKGPVTLDFYDQGQIKQLQARLGDVAISRFTNVLGTQVTGEKDVEWKPHTDAEVERIYQRVAKALSSGKFSTCRSSK